MLEEKHISEEEFIEMGKKRATLEDVGILTTIIRREVREARNFILIAIAAAVLVALFVLS